MLARTDIGATSLAEPSFAQACEVGQVSEERVGGRRVRAQAAGGGALRKTLRAHAKRSRMSKKPDWANARTVVWYRDDAVTGAGLIIQRGDLLWKDLEEMRAVDGIRSLRDLRRAATSYPWLSQWYEEYYEGSAVDDQELVDKLRDYYDEYRRPVLWDGERIRSWLPPELADHIKISGASPGGNMDCAEWSNDAVEHFTALGFRAVEDRVLLDCLP